tara:strand:+ start:154 stop:522 length:369 start_codon:yes stop_codon:yes gene_type:complete
MANICAVCNKKTGFMTSVMIQDEIFVHQDCLSTFNKEPEKYGGKAIEKTEADIEAAEKKVEEEYVVPQQENEDKSVYVKGFSMPFGEMVEFMVKWAIASIPAFIILFIIFGILFLIFGSIFF